MLQQIQQRLKKKKNLKDKTTQINKLIVKEIRFVVTRDKKWAGKIG